MRENGSPNGVSPPISPPSPVDGTASSSSAAEDIKINTGDCSSAAENDATAAESHAGTPVENVDNHPMAIMAGALFPGLPLDPAIMAYSFTARHAAVARWGLKMPTGAGDEEHLLRHAVTHGDDAWRAYIARRALCEARSARRAEQAEGRAADALQFLRSADFRGFFGAGELVRVWQKGMGFIQGAAKWGDIADWDSIPATFVSAMLEALVCEHHEIGDVNEIIVGHLLELRLRSQLKRVLEEHPFQLAAEEVAHVVAGCFWHNSPDLKGEWDYWSGCGSVLFGRDACRPLWLIFDFEQSSSFRHSPDHFQLHSQRLDMVAYEAAPAPYASAEAGAPGARSAGIAPPVDGVAIASSHLEPIPFHEFNSGRARGAQAAGPAAAPYLKRQRRLLMTPGEESECSENDEGNEVSGRSQGDELSGSSQGGEVSEPREAGASAESEGEGGEPSGDEAQESDDGAQVSDDEAQESDDGAQVSDGEVQEPDDGAQESDGESSGSESCNEIPGLDLGIGISAAEAADWLQSLLGRVSTASVPPNAALEALAVAGCAALPTGNKTIARIWKTHWVPILRDPGSVEDNLVTGGNLGAWRELYSKIATRRWQDGSRITWISVEDQVQPYLESNDDMFTTRNIRPGGEDELGEGDGLDAEDGRDGRFRLEEEGEGRLEEEERGRADEEAH